MSNPGALEVEPKIGMAASRLDESGGVKITKEDWLADWSVNDLLVDSMYGFSARS